MYKDYLKTPKLDEMKVVNLRWERVDSAGKKQVLQERLWQLLIQNGEHPDDFEFELSGLEPLDVNLQAKIKSNSQNLGANVKAKIEANSQSRIKN